MCSEVLVASKRKSLARSNKTWSRLVADFPEDDRESCRRSRLDRTSKLRATHCHATETKFLFSRSWRSPIRLIGMRQGCRLAGLSRGRSPMYKNARGKKPYSSPKLAQTSEPHSEPKETRGSGTAKQWKKKVQLEKQQIREKLEARRREGF